MAVPLFIAKLIMSCALLYGYYQLFLRNKRFHHYNRFYLLAAVLLSLIIPFINIPVNLFWGNQQHSALIQTLRVINANGWEEPVTIYARQNQWSKWLSIQNGLYFIYIAGAITGFIILVRSLAWIKNLERKYTYHIIDNLKIYNTTEPGTPFSFFRSIFWDKKISLNDEPGQQIFRHEMFHVNENHSADVLLMEVICCICWFNPFFHLIKKEIKAIHEFLADEYAVSANNRYDYAELLVSHAITQKTLGLINPFFHNQIKRRITMITQSNLLRRSGYFSRIMALPMLFVIVSAFAVKLTSKSSSASNPYFANKNMTVVIDAGHGGMYPGSNSNIGILEKDINLSIAQKIKELGTQYNLNIILTRNKDEVVGNAATLKEDLLNRVKITNEAKADLFVSIHVNATGEKSTSMTGFEAYISGKNENPKARQLSSVILAELKGIYTVNETIQQREVGIQVLDHNICPAIMIQCGYITNPKDAEFISNPVNQEKIARKILEGIVKYSNAQTASAGIYTQQKLNEEIISAEELSKMNVDDIKTITADMTKTTGIVFLKTGGIKSFNIKEVNDYYTANHIDGPLKGYLVNVNMKDSVADIIFTKDTVPGNSYNKIFSKVEVEADYPGWSAYLVKNLVYPKKAQDKEVQGTVIVQFIVDEQGKVSDVKCISGPALLKAESIRIVKESGTWTSAMQNGKKVKAYKKQPITYKLEAQN